MPLPFNPTTLFDLADKLGIIQSVKAKLFDQPDVAAYKLAIVLGELSKIYVVCESELLRYLSITFNKDANMTEERKALLTLEGGQIMNRTQEARGHCHKIWNIYENYLNKWFNKILSEDEIAQMEGLFKSLSYADSQMDMALTELSRWLTSEAEKVLDLVDQEEYERANEIIRAARKEILPTRKAINAAMSRMQQLQSDFILMAKVV